MSFQGPGTGLTGTAASLNIGGSAGSLSTTYTAGRILYGAGSGVPTTVSTFFYDSANGRVGIGTASPGTTLQVSGTTATLTCGGVVGTSNVVQIGSPTTYYGTSSAYISTRFAILTSGLPVTNDAFNGNGGVYASGQGIRIQGQDLSWGGGAVRSYASSIEVDGGGSKNAAISYGQIRFYTANNQRLTIDESGNVGIGNTTPPIILWVPGTSTTTGLGVYNFDVAMILGNLAGGINGGSIQVRAGGNSSTIGTTNYILALNPDGGSVGVGTNNPNAYKFTVNGGAIGVIGTSNYLYYAVTNSTNSGAYMLFDAQTAGGSGRKYQIGSTGTGNNPGTGCFEIYDATGGATRMVVNASGYVGIGTASPNQKLHVYGSMQLDRGATAYYTQTGTTSYTGGTWYTLIPIGSLTQLGATYLISGFWQSNPGGNPYNLATSFLWYNQYCNDPNTSQLSGAAVPTNYHASNGSGDYQIMVRAQSSYNSYCGIQFKFNRTLGDVTGYWQFWCHIISY